MKDTRWSHYSIGILACAWVFAVSPVLAEVYIAGYGGVAFPNQLTDVEAQGSLTTMTPPATIPFSGVSLSDIDLQTGAMVGGKIGGYLPNLAWLGAEVEFFYANPKIKQQNIGISFLGVSDTLEGVSGADFRTLTGALNLVLRYPGKLLQPYAGVGLAIVNGRISDAGGSSSDTKPGLNVLAGLRVLLMDHVALFGEFKYTRVTFKFEQDIDVDSAILSGAELELEATYAAPAVVGGLSIHF